MNNRGAIICGYQGIGKSTASKCSNLIIDLESGSFWQGDFRQSDWYEIYAKIAINLAEQGYAVCIASHKVVRDYLSSIPIPTNIKLYCCYPSLHLESVWIDKLQKRFNNTGLHKDYKALMNAKEMFKENIKDLQSQPKFDKIELTSMGYSLVDELERVVYNEQC